MMVCAGTALVFNSVPVFLVCGIFIMTVVFYNVHFPNLYAFLQEIVPPASYGKITSAVEIQNQLAFVLSGGLAAVLLEGVPMHVLEALSHATICSHHGRTHSLRKAHLYRWVYIFRGCITPMENELCESY